MTISNELGDTLDRLKRLTASDSKRIVGLPFKGAWIWYLLPGVYHPLRETVRRSPFFLATANPNVEADESPVEPVYVDYVTLNLVHLGTTIASRDALDILGQDWNPTGYSRRLCRYDLLLHPLTPSKAAQLLGKFNSIGPGNQSSSEENVPMFVLATNQYSCLRTMHTDQTGDRHCYHGCRLATGMLPLVYRIEDCGQVNSAHNSFSLESEMAAFKRTAIDSDSDPVSLAYARYDILSPPESDMIESSISLECQWKSPPSLLSPPSMSASLAVHILHVNGEADAEHHNPTSMLRKELGMIRSWGVGTEDPSQLQFFGKGASMSSLIDRFLDDAKSQGFQISNFAPTTTSLVALGGDPLPSRSDADFVEKIWELVVNHCSDLSDFQDALTSVISELEEGKLLPMIHRSNHTGFGQQIRECLALSRMNQLGKDYEARKQMVQGVFDTYLENPGDCLLEIGVWKLKRDYTHHLIGNDLANWGDLEFFLDASHGMSQQILLLQCLHQVVELWTLLKDNFLILPLEHMKVVVKGALDHYKHMMQDILADDELGQSEALQRIMENTVYNVRLQRYGSASIKLLENMQQGFDPSIWSVVIACTRSGRAQAVLFSKDNMLFDGDRDDGAFQMDTDPAKDWTIHSAVDSSRQWNVTRAMRCL